MKNTSNFYYYFLISIFHFQFAVWPAKRRGGGRKKKGFTIFVYFALIDISPHTNWGSIGNSVPKRQVWRYFLKDFLRLLKKENVFWLHSFFFFFYNNTCPLHAFLNKNEFQNMSDSRSFVFGTATALSEIALVLSFSTINQFMRDPPPPSQRRFVMWLL